MYKAIISKCSRFKTYTIWKVFAEYSICHFRKFHTYFVIMAGTLGLAVVAEAQNS